MFKILQKERLNDSVTRMVIQAPRVAKKAGPGQFIILRIDENGERIPLTIAGYDREQGTVTIIFQKVGKTTIHLDELEAGDALLDFVGPLGRVSEYGDVKGKRVAVIGGGLGIAIAYPQAVALHELGAKVDVIVGFRNIGLAILLDELQAAAENLIVMTDDGSNGDKGFVTDALKRRLDAGVQYEQVIAIGPMPMMRAVCEMTRPAKIHTVVSMNPIMIDGTGMCGGCRLTVGGETKFACVDGPEFDGHLVDFDEAMKRSRMYSEEEKLSKEKHVCRMKEAAEHVQ
ncbi:MAG TPA: sulfide/dihydroorotate dehydrogenase-like FAD/NAD-binding protein [Candidatus Pullichristensenella excrementigallinarum]|uniref:Sulfide/dihydroorotate dehydrogenase-like FAD/NAD-binding protein n=1 Tax=Candidatus Pullichristensenella excrementigallinarum TaxID=2840907 RepID=A0A9D1IB20_9FIRM|nr:sulfide/dihydroorotate dehydrogenase-like FAD/NAD-binding protein [Candidatus Pullichristensenella excrementigallinarum]